ncbi:MAG: ribosome silencing factor [Deltaproteobacteria bacterium]|nr:ribosome silencing factor [Deltaproteobacteria bacterium]
MPPKRPTRTAKPARRADAKTARPKAPRAKRPAGRASTTTVKQAADERSHQRAKAVAKAALDKKAENVLLIDVRGLTSISDYFVVMSGAAGPQLKAIAENVEVELKKQGVMPISVEGQGGSWVLLDYGDVVAHIFEDQVRSFYDLEGLWADAPRELIRD